MKTLFVLPIVCSFLLALTLTAQQPTPAATPTSTPASAKSSEPAAFGSVTGHISCADTGQPARFAGVQLLSEQPAAPLLDPKDLGKDADFSKALAKSMSAVMKGNGLSAITDIEGNFTLDKVAPGTYYLIPQLAGYLSPLSLFSQQERLKADTDTMSAVEGLSQKITVNANQVSRADATLERGGSLSGTIRYDDGSPAPNVAPTLLLQQKDGKWKELNLSGILPPTTDDSGHYRFFGVPAGKYAVKATLPTTQMYMGVGSGSFSLQMKLGDALVVYSGAVYREKEIKPIELGAGESQSGIDLVFPISGLHTVSGTVVAKADNHAVNAGTVELDDPETKAKLRTVMIDPDGSFRFNYVLEGEYTLLASNAADTVKKDASVDDSGNPFGRLMNSKTVKKYGEATLPLTIKSDTVGLSLQVPNAAPEKDDVKKSAQ
jgi:hypothetical protein